MWHPRAPGGGSWSTAARSICDFDPGFEVTAGVSTGLRSLVQVWRGDRSWPEALRSGAVVVDGPSLVRRELPRWLGQSDLASVFRPA